MARVLITADLPSVARKIVEKAYDILTVDRVAIQLMDDSGVLVTEDQTALTTSRHVMISRTHISTLGADVVGPGEAAKQPLVRVARRGRASETLLALPLQQQSPRRSRSTNGS